MNLRAIIAVTAVALMPMAASAAVVENCDSSGNPVGGAGDVTGGDVYNCDFNAFDTNGSVQLDFFASSTPAGAVSSNINLSEGNSLTSATLAWWEADSGGNLLSLITSEEANLNDAKTRVTTVFDGTAPDYQSVVFSWTGFSSGNQLPMDINIQVVPNAVPVPAGILLMGTALAGFGVMRRRKTNKAA